jgi:para-aminobenzoate synthetase component 1
MERPSERSALAVRELPAAWQPLGAYERLRAGEAPWLLDSALRLPRLGRFSFAGADPWLVLRARGERVELDCRRALRPGVEVGHRVVEGDVLAIARELLPRLDPTLQPMLPFVSGAVGWLGYELAERLERLVLPMEDDLALPDALLLFVDRVVVWDHEQDTGWALALGCGGDDAAARAAAEASIDAFWSRLEGEPAPPRPQAPRRPAAPFAFFEEGGYAKAVDQVKDEIAAGNVYQANLTHRMERDFAGDPWALYRALRRINPAPFACFLELPEVSVTGSSPELFLRVHPGGLVESRPIKGTRPRGRHGAEDDARRAALAASEKDRAENLMIVDLVRNDLGRVCEIGSVAVPELMQVEEYASVFQLVSSVTGRLRPDRDVFDLLRATFPPGSMTGAPKIAAMTLLARLEPVRRAIYSGAIGYLDVRGGADLSVVIRTLLLKEGRAYLHSGGAVVADSDPRDEWRETLDKAAPLQAALDQLEGDG